MLKKKKKEQANKTWKDTEEHQIYISWWNNQSEKATYCMIPTYYIMEKAKLWKQQKDQWLQGILEEWVKKSVQSCWPSDPMDCKPPGSSVHEILQEEKGGGTNKWCAGDF